MILAHQWNVDIKWWQVCGTLYATYNIIDLSHECLADNPVVNCFLRKNAMQSGALRRSDKQALDPHWWLFQKFSISKTVFAGLSARRRRDRSIVSLSDIFWPFDTNISLIGQDHVTLCHFTECLSKNEILTSIRHNSCLNLRGEWRFSGPCDPTGLELSFLCKKSTSTQQLPHLLESWSCWVFRVYKKSRTISYPG